MVTSTGTPKGAHMAGLAEQIQSEGNKRSGRKSRIAEVLEQLDEEDGAALIAALDDLTVKAVVIHRVMGARGIVLSETAISNYRAVRNVAQ